MSLCQSVLKQQLNCLLKSILQRPALGVHLVWKLVSPLAKVRWRFLKCKNIQLPVTVKGWLWRVPAGVYNSRKLDNVSHGVLRRIEFVIIVVAIQTVLNGRVYSDKSSGFSCFCRQVTPSQQQCQHWSIPPCETDEKIKRWMSSNHLN